MAGVQGSGLGFRARSLEFPVRIEDLGWVCMCTSCVDLIAFLFNVFAK